MFKPNRVGSHQITDMGLERIALHVHSTTGLGSWTKQFGSDEFIKVLPTGLSNNAVLLQDQIACGTYKQDTTETANISANHYLMLGIPINGEQDGQHYYYTVNGSYSFGNDRNDTAAEFVIGRVGSTIFPNLNQADAPGTNNTNINILTSTYELGHDAFNHPGYTAQGSPIGVYEGNISRTILEGNFHSVENSMPVVFGIRIQANDQAVIRKLSVSLSIQKYKSDITTFDPGK